MEKENEVVVYEQNGEIAEYNFERVDFSKPASLLSYGGDVQEDISAILHDTSKMVVDNREIYVDDKLLESISSFDESLDETDIQREKKDLPIVAGVKNFLTNLGVKKFKEEEERNSYQGQFEEYCRRINMIREAMETQKQGALNDIELRECISAELTPKIAELEERIRIGKMDLDAFNAEIEALKTQPQSLDLDYEIERKKQLSEFFNGRLNELEKIVVAYKAQNQQYKLQQGTSMQTVKSCDSYIRDTAPILEAQGSVMVFNRQEARRQEQLQKINDMANLAVRKNAQEVEQNAATAVALSLNNGLSVDTLTEVANAYNRGLQTFKEGRIARQKQVDTERQALQTLDHTLSDYHNEVLQLIDDNSIMTEVLGKSSTKPSITKKPYSKKIGK